MESAVRNALSVCSSRRSATLRVFLVASIILARNVRAGDVSFRLPLSTDSASHFFVDHDAASGIRDWACNDETYDNHHGSDYPKVKDTPIYAAARGKIIEKDDGHGDGCLNGCTPLNGNFVRLEHANGMRTVYLHMEQGTVTKKAVGQWVECGEEIGKVGRSGKAAGYHLHFEVQRDSSSNYIDPYAGPCSSSYSYWLDQNGRNPKPSCDPAVSFLKQYRANGSTEIAVGGATGDTHVVFKAKVGTEQLTTAKLQIELRRTTEFGGDFTGDPTHESSWVESGSIAVIDSVYGLILADYHWRGRIVASLSGQTYVGTWISFGDNQDAAADFTVAPICQAPSLYPSTLSTCEPDDPTVTTTPATNVGMTSATINGTVQSRASALQVWFEYGPSLPYQFATGSASIPANSGPWNVYADLIGLSCNTTYHYRLVASGGGTWSGADATFNTSSCPSSCAVQVLQPNGGETWRHGEQRTINWSTSGAACGSSQELGLVYPDGSLLQITPAASGGAFTWTVPSSVTPGSGYRILAFDAASLSGDRSDGTFAIVEDPSAGCTLQMNYPNGGETFYTGQLITILWSVNGDACGSAQTVVLRDVGGQSGWILTTDARNGQYQWLIPAWVPTASGYRLRVWDDASFTADESDGTQTIIQDTESPSIEIRSPTTASEIYITTGSITLSGYSSDNVDVSRVWWSDSTGATGTGSGTNAWTIGPLSVPLGRTTIWTYAEDGSGNLGTDSIDVVRSLAPPSGIIATANGTNQITVGWTVVEGAAWYQIFRGDHGTFDQYNVVEGTTYVDTNVVADTGYIYAVRSISPDGQQFSELSRKVVATTIAFADDPLMGNVLIRAVHHNELTRGANAIRTAVGLSPAPLATVAKGDLVRASQFQAIKTALCEALDLYLIPCNLPTDAQVGGVIRAEHIRGLRDLMR